MFNKATPVEHIKEIYWFTHFLFLCGAFLLAVFARSVNDQDIYTLLSYNFLMLLSFSCFLLLNYLFNKTCKERFGSGKYTYRILYAVVLTLFTVSFVSILYVEIYNLIYIVPIVLIALTSGTYLGLISSLLFIGNTVIHNNVIHNNELILDNMVVFLCFFIVAWVVGKISDSNKDYALKLEKERDFLKGLIQTFSEGVLISDSLGRVILCNKQVEQIFDKNSNELIGQEEAGLWQNCSVPYHKWSPNFINMEIENQGNNYLICRFILNSPIDETNCFVTVINNITKIQQQKKKMQRLATLSAIGELAAGAAHEIRNPLTTVRGFLQLLQAKGETDQFKSLYDLATGELDRINVIITSMLELARPQKGDFQRININEMINDIWELYNYSGTLKGISYQKNLNDKVLPFLGSTQQVKQLLLNIMQNAERACDCNDTIYVKTYSNNKYIYIEIQDTGKGINYEHLQRIMNPFFTTEANGTGLGLAICNRVIEDHNGEIKVASELGVGTTFTLIFPVASVTLEKS